MELWWMSGWDRVSSMLWPSVWIGLVLNWDGLSCLFVADLRVLRGGLAVGYGYAGSGTKGLIWALCGGFKPGSGGGPVAGWDGGVVHKVG